VEPTKEKEKDREKEREREKDNKEKPKEAEKEKETLIKSKKDESGDKDKQNRDKKKSSEAPKKEIDEPEIEIPTMATVKTFEWDGKDPDSALFGSQMECILLMLEARSILNKMVNWRCAKELKAVKGKRNRPKGQFSVPDIQNILKMQPDDEDTDWVSEIQELKRQLVKEIRRNHVLDRDVQRLDKRIGLLIANRTNLQDVFLYGEKKRRKKKVQGGGPQPTFDLVKDPKKLECYQDLFLFIANGT